MMIWGRLRGYLAFRRGKMQRFWGHIMIQRSHYEAAVSSFSHALRWSPDWVEVHLARGLLYWRELNDPSQAIADFSHVLVLIPDHAEAFFYRGMAHQALGSYPASAADLRSALIYAGPVPWRRNAQRQLSLVESILSELPPALPPSANAVNSGPLALPGQTGPAEDDAST